PPSFGILAAATAVYAATFATGLRRRIPAPAV
ncbi:MAG: hypothetical protein QOI83_3946, partial [Streptomycetaceae bacterium]|nr:hypothetical protein [Streptomycetaceae bacterium]